MSEPDFESILNAFTSPILLARPVAENGSTKDFEFLFFNSAFRKILNPKFYKARTFSELREDLNPEVPWLDLADHAMNGLPPEPITYFSKDANLWLRLEMKKAKNSLLLVMLTDITQEKEFDQKLKDSAFTDFLTKLPNRNQFQEDFTQNLAEASFKSQKLGILLIDIDNMKNINDSNGQSAGNDVLKKSAEILSKFSPETVSSYRYGDDEFLVLIKNISSSDTLLNITDTIFESFLIEQISVSGGISVYPDSSESGDDLERFADIAMHQAKKDGKKRFTFFEPDMLRIFIRKLNMQNRMAKASFERDFKLNFQPQFDIKSGNLRGFEALIRWNDEELGEIGPSIFIPVAEETGLIIPIGTWILDTAFKTQKRWQEKFNFTGVLSVNISPLQLKQPDFMEIVQSEIDKYEISPSSIEIEITEGIMIDNMEDAILKMKMLKDMGFRLSLDDFGTGYSSLSYLQALPLNTLKIDKSFINDITSTDGIQANITNSIIMMVSKMGLDTIAEGVEKPEQLDLLKKFNCHIVQGFLRGKPMPQENCERYLSGDKTALLSIEMEAKK